MIRTYKVLTDAIEADPREVANLVTSETVDIRGAKRVSIILKRASHSAGSSTFVGYVGATDENGNSTGGIAYNKWITNTTNANTADVTRVGSVALAATTVVEYSMSTEDVFGWLYLTCHTATDGKGSAWIVVDYADTKQI
jgi:hypothetical protein